MNRKPITEHLADLPEEYREEALRLHQESGWANDEFEFQSSALANGFPWMGLVEYDFELSGNKWSELYEVLKSKGL